MYPISLNLENRWCLVVGGGAVAKRKIKSLLEAKAYVRVVALKVDDDITATEICVREFVPCDVEGMTLVFAATSNEQTQVAVKASAKKFGVLVNVVSSAKDSDFHIPAVLRDGDVSVAVSTNGASPILACKIRDSLTLPEGIGEFAFLVSEIRARVIACEFEEEKCLSILEEIASDESWSKFEELGSSSWQVWADSFIDILEV